MYWKDSLMSYFKKKGEGGGDGEMFQNGKHEAHNY